VLFIYALRHLDAARAAAHFSTAPFIGAALAIPLLGEPVTWTLVAAAALMALAIWLVLTETHEHEHAHEHATHTHRHLHDEHHQHAHRGDAAALATSATSSRRARRRSSDISCMMENMGRKGTQAHADCNPRLWNGSGSCTRGGYACINCTAPGFEEPGHSFAVTPRIAGIPIGLPTDMPKACFVALASLSKAATPHRVRQNAVSTTPSYRLPSGGLPEN
jgi:hypothetical protein